MPDLEDIAKAAKLTDEWLMEKQAKHIKMVEKSVQNLQDSIIDNLDILKTESGALEGVKVNLKQAQKLHKKIEVLFGTEFNDETKKIIDDFKSTKGILIDSFGILDESADFTDIDEKMMKVLRDGYYQDYLSLSGAYKDKVVQSVYNMVIGNGTMSSLVKTIEGTLAQVGAVDVTGRSLMQYSRLYANDMIMNFHGQVTLEKAKDLGIKKFLYYGTIIKTSRKFCIQRVGKVYTKDQIDSWTYKWTGKSGPAFTNRGGYNCRHHWQPVREEWLEDYSNTEMQSYFKEVSNTKKVSDIKPPQEIIKQEPKPSYKLTNIQKGS